MSLTDEGHYGPKQLNMLKVIWGEGYLSPGDQKKLMKSLESLIYQTKKF